MKKLISILALIITVSINSFAGVCDVGTLEYDAITCAAGSNVAGNPGAGGPGAGAVPIDGGTSILILSGVVIGSRKALAKFKNWKVEAKTA